MPTRPLSAFTALPDVATHSAGPGAGTLDRVGMSRVETPIRWRGEDGIEVRSPALADAMVSLDDASARGIHMSRLFLSLQSILDEETLTLATVRRILDAFVGSHADISASASVVLSFHLPLKRRSLVSRNANWRTYAVEVAGDMQEGRATYRLRVQVPYSSTCPCSAALARQVIQERFRSDFAGRLAVPAEEVAQWLSTEEAICATPHSQRSYATLDITTGDALGAPSLVELIDLVEATLKTPVQAAVKREDEQEFARLNGQNLMFCEDAGRRLKAAVEADPRIVDYRVEVRHVESLHPHDAVSIAVRGLPNGLRP